MVSPFIQEVNISINQLNSMEHHRPQLNDNQE